MQNKFSDIELWANIKRLLIEADLNKSDAEILEEFNNYPDADIDAFLRRI